MLLKKSLICLSLLFVTDIVVSKPDYLFHSEVNGWLKLHVVPATWLEAFLTCHDEGAVLASPINAELFSAMREIMNQSDLDSPIYTGVNAEISHRYFISIEGVPLADMPIKWSTPYDGKKAEDYLTFSSDGKTLTSSGKASLPYICYKKLDNSMILNQCGTLDNDYHFYQATGSCYKYHKKLSTWERAYTICAAEGGHLLIVNTRQEAKTIRDIMLKTEYNNSCGIAIPFGLRDWSGHNTWLTIHGEKEANGAYNWVRGEMDSKGTNVHANFYPTDTYDEVNCGTSLLPFICEKDPNTSRFENNIFQIEDLLKDW